MPNIELRDLIKEIVKNEFEEIYGVACRVSNVHEDSELGFVCDCEPINGTATVTDVRIEPETSGDVLILPADNSVVFITMESETQAFISMFGRIDSIQYLGGDNGGVPKVSELVDKITALEDRMTDHQHTTTINGVPTTIDPLSNPIITNTTINDLENIKFTH